MLVLKTGNYLRNNSCLTEQNNSVTERITSECQTLETCALEQTEVTINEQNLNDTCLESAPQEHKDPATVAEHPDETLVTVSGGITVGAVAVHDN